MSACAPSSTALPAIDEMVDGHAGLRPHWRPMLGAFSELGEGGLAARAARLDRAFEEEGLSSVLPGATEQAWRCDPVPLLLRAGEFAALAAGLAQRAALLEQVLGDIYGAQSLLASGALPPALVYANPGYLRFGRMAGQASLLHFYAADLIRGPDGAWRVLADRTVTAAGVGYARENRRLLARVMPEAFRAMQVRQLTPFFDTWQEALRRLAPPHPDARPNAGMGDPAGRSPTVALLTPGTASPLWFEHMYLSRELSCALVEGGDLTVRGGQVFLKTLRGLQQVDVLLRRIDGRMIDPLELEAGSLIGVPGLIDAARAGSVRITNDPGSGAAEAPAWAAFLPDLCRRLRGETLLLDSVPTRWLGTPGALAEVQQDLTRWLLQPALDGTGGAQSLASMSPPDRQALLARIAARPWEWGATEATPASVAPCMGPTGMVPRPVVLRLFLVHDGVAWQTMPGGFARVSEGAGMLGERGGGLPDSGISKDVWVLAEDEEDIVGPAAHPIQALRLRRTTGDLPSRVADDLFWLGRYVERLEGAARLVRAAATRLSRAEAMLPREAAELHALASCLADAGIVAEEATLGPVVSGLGRGLLDSVGTGGAIDELLRTIAGLTESVRDRLTGDMYATFIQTLRSAQSDAAAVEAAGARRPGSGGGGSGAEMDALAHAMVRILRFSTAVAGVAAENMVRGGGWLFLELGRRIERANAIVAEIAFALDQPPQRIEIGLRLVLELCDSAITYRSRYLNVVQPAPVLDLVLADQGNPRGLAFQLVAMHTLLDELGSDGGAREMLAGAAAGLLAEVEAMVGSVLAASDQARAAADLPGPLRDVANGLSELSNRITRRYFALLPATRTLGMQGLVVGGEAGRLRGAA